MKKDRQKLMDYLKSQRLMSLATFSWRPWISIVYYVVDADMNLYFVSEPKTRHCKDIALNNHVACAIADSRQSVAGKKAGVQIQGIAKAVNNANEIKRALKMWNKANPGIGHIINFQSMKSGAINSRVYKVQPKTIKFFNEALYGPEGYKIFKF